MERMRALRSWLNKQREGRVTVGDVIYVTLRRRKELERAKLAVYEPAVGPSATKPAGPSVTKPAAPTSHKAVAARHSGGSWYEILDADGNVLRKVRGKKKRDEALED